MIKNLMRLVSAVAAVIISTATIYGAPQITSQPTAPTVVSAGQTFTLKVGAQGQGTLQFQWYKNGVEMPNETDPLLAFFPLKLTDSARYHVRVTDTTGFVDSSPVVLRVSPPSELSISRQPSDITVQEGVNTSVSVEVSSSGTPRYQWYHNGTPVAGATSSTLAFPAIRLSQGGEYYVEISDSVSTVTSRAASISVLPGAVQIVDQIGDQLLHSGQSITLWVEVVMQEPVPLQFQWFKDGQPVTFATKSTLAINSFSVANEGNYHVRIQTPDTVIESDPIKLELNRQGIFITRNPGSFEVLIGGSVAFEVEAVSERTLNYQWFKDGVEIPGATTSKYTIPAVSSTHSGLYTCQISNSISFVRSLAGRLVTFEGALKVEIHPQPKIGLEGQTIALSAKIIGSEVIIYQWMKDGEPVSGATFPNLILENITAADSGQYSLQGRAGDFFVETHAADLLVRTLEVVILNQPATQQVIEGDAIQLSVIATSPRSIQYQWFFNGQPIPNATGATLNIPNATGANAGEYHVELKSVDESVTSQKATVTVGQNETPGVSVRIRKNSDKLDIVWQSVDQQLQLQASPSVGSDAQWQPVAVQPDTSSGEFSTVSLPAPESTTFFRVAPGAQ